jgi:hypothetical protein
MNDNFCNEYYLVRTFSGVSFFRPSDKSIEDEIKMLGLGKIIDCYMPGCWNDETLLTLQKLVVSNFTGQSIHD